MLQRLTGCPLLPLPRPAATAVIDGEGRRVIWTSRSDWPRGAVVRSFKAIRPCTHEWFGSSEVARSSHWSSVRYRHGASWTQRPRPFSRRLPDGRLQRTLVAVFGRYTDLPSADIGVRIIHRSRDFYTVAKIYGWGAYYIQSFTVVTSVMMTGNFTCENTISQFLSFSTFNLCPVL